MPAARARLDGRPSFRVALVCNIKRPEAPGDAEAEFDEPATIAAIAAALEAGGDRVTVMEADAELPARLVEERPDIVFNIAEGVGGRGREGHVPALLEFLHIPYTGSDAVTLGLCLDKALCKHLLRAFDIPHPRWRLLRRGETPETAGWPEPPALPVIVKPNAEGSSKGITELSVARTTAELDAALAAMREAYDCDLIVEQLVEGREFTVGVLGNGADLRVFAPMEIVFTDPAHPIYSYAVKQDFRRYVRYACPPELDGRTLERLTRYAGRAYQALECRDCARFDFRIDGEGWVYLLEANPLPGLAPGYSDFPMLAEFAGVGYDELVRAILDAALKRHGMLPPAGGGGR